MPDPRFLCCGDQHFEAGADLCLRPGERLAEQESVWRATLALARKEAVTAVLHLGDAFEKARPSPEALLAFERPLVEHQAAGGAPVFAILGNHDVSSVASGSGLEVFAQAGLLFLAQEPKVYALAGVTLACLPWVSTSRLVAEAGGGDRDEVNVRAAALLVEAARGLRAQIEGPAILLTHFAISGAVTASAETGIFREPVLDTNDLARLGFDAIVVGHLHRPQSLFADCFYVGSPMPLSFGESEQHGIWRLTFAQGRILRDFIELPSRGFQTFDVDATAVPDLGEPWIAPSAGLDGDFVKIRLTVSAEQARQVNLPLLKQCALDAGAYRVWVELQVEREERVRVEGLDESLDELSAFDLYLGTKDVGSERAVRLRARTEDYLKAAHG